MPRLATRSVDCSGNVAADGAILGYVGNRLVVDAHPAEATDAHIPDARSRLRGTAREVSFQRKVPVTNAKPSFGILGCTKARPFLDGTRRTELGWTIYFFGPNTFHSQSVNSQMKVLRAFRLMGLTLVF